MKLFLLILSLTTVGCSQVKFSAYKASEVVTEVAPVDPLVVDNLTPFNGAFEISNAGKLSQINQIIIQSSLGSFSPAQASHSNSVVSVKTGYSESLGELF